MQLNIVLIVLLLTAASFTVEAQFKTHMANNRLFQAQKKEREYRSKQSALKITRTKLLNFDRLNAVAGEQLQLVKINLQAKQPVSISQALAVNEQTKGGGNE